jgi:hypothetical protein
VAQHTQRGIVSKQFPPGKQQIHKGWMDRLSRYSAERIPHNSTNSLKAGRPRVQLDRVLFR